MAYQVHLTTTQLVTQGIRLIVEAASADEAAEKAEEATSQHPNRVLVPGVTRFLVVASEADRPTVFIEKIKEVRIAEDN